MTFLGISKPSEALEAMVRGLLGTKEPKPGRTEQVNMLDFGTWREEGNICFGCCATYTLQALCPDVVIDANNTNGLRRNDEIKRKKGVDTSEIAEFENAMDDVRLGSMESLFDFFELSEDDKRKMDRHILRVPYLTQTAWEADIPAVQDYIKLLQHFGL